MVIRSFLFNGKKFGFKYSPEEQRERIFEIIRKSPNGIWCSKIVRKLREDHPGVSKNTILERLKELIGEKRIRYAKYGTTKVYFSACQTGRLQRKSNFDLNH